MDQELLGLKVLVKMKNPPSSLHGFVCKVQDQRLTLRDVLFLRTGKRYASYIVHGAEIEDLDVLKPDDAHNMVAAAEPPIDDQPAIQKPVIFLDPAIVGFARTPYTDLPSGLELPHHGQLSGHSELENRITSFQDHYKSLPRYNEKSLDVADITARPTIAATATKSKRKKKSKKLVNELVQDTPYHNITEDPAHVVWRRTPILQEQSTPKASRGATTSSAALVNGSPAHRKTRHDRAMMREIEKNNGWTTEATDVQDLGDFDFAANLSRFDKQSVWAELRNEDTTADEDRLVSFNRVVKPKPGTFGGQKLHPSENVLARKNITKSIHADSDSEPEISVGVSGVPRRLRRDSSRVSSRHIPSRKNSLRPTPVAIASGGGSEMVRSSSQRVALSEPIGSGLQPQYMGSSTSSLFSPSLTANKPCLRYNSTGLVCRTIEPEILRSIENLSLSGLDMTDDILAENAGRGLAEVVISAIDPGGHRIDQAANHNAPPVVVMLIGENKTGARALAAARHLLDRNVRVIASLTGALDLEHGPLGKQVLRISGVKTVRSWSETSAHLKTLDAPPELIVDALLGAHATFDDLDADHFDTATEMIAWANMSRASVLSVDVPSGVDSLTGTVQMREGEPLEVRARIVACFGIPCTGLLEAMTTRDEDASMKISIVDIGLNPAAKHFLKPKKSHSEVGGKYIQFGTSWVIAANFDPGTLVGA